MNAIKNAATDGGAPTPTPEKSDREIPQLKTKRRTKTRFRLILLGVGLLMIVLIGFAAAAFMDRLQSKKVEEVAAQAKAKPETASSTKADFEGFKKRARAEEAARTAATTPAQQAGNGLYMPASAKGHFADAKMAGGAVTGSAGQDAAGGKPAGSVQPPPLTREQRQLSGDLLVGEESGEPTSPGSFPGMQLPQLSQLRQLPDLLGAESRQSPLEQQLKPSKLEGVAAVRRKNLDLQMRAGTNIPCGQFTYIVSTNSGQALCVVSKDVYSANGSTLLVERGSHVLGERHQPLQLGQKMMPVLWRQIETPHGVLIDINSLATDSLGASGLPVEVDTHFGARFGAAIMLSLISDVGDAAANAASNGGSTIRLGTTAGVGQDLANKALDKTIDIPPTGYSVQGSAINIFVARNVDFGGVYELARY